MLEDVGLSLLQASNPMEVLTHVLGLQSQRRKIVLVLLWDWWTTRNKANAGKLVRTTDQVCHTIQKHWREFDTEGERVLSETPTSRNADHSSSG
jgi:hypothetical protein